MGPCSRSGCVGLPDWVLVLLAWPSGVCGGLGAGIKVLPFCTPVRKIGRRPKSGPCPVGDPHGASACSLGGPHLGASACCRWFPSSPGVCCGGTGVVLHKKNSTIPGPGTETTKPKAFLSSVRAPLRERSLWQWFKGVGFECRVLQKSV